jgi:DNA-binding NarL/FixJ family response regulator
MLSPRVVVVDDHDLVRHGIVRQVSSVLPGATFVYEGRDPVAAVAAALEFGCDCAIVDLDLGDQRSVAEVVTGFTLHGIPVLVVSALATPGALSAAVTAGAIGYVTKSSSASDLEAALKSALRGRSWIAPDLAGLVLRGSSALVFSDQERRVLTFYASGLTVDMVARRMEISPHTVKHYLNRVRHKCEIAGHPARTKVELNSVARQAGLLP